MVDITCIEEEIKRLQEEINERQNELLAVKHQKYLIQRNEILKSFDSTKPDEKTVEFLMQIKDMKDPEKHIRKTERLIKLFGEDSEITKKFELRQRLEIAREKAKIWEPEKETFDNLTPYFGRLYARESDIKKLEVVKYSRLPLGSSAE